MTPERHALLVKQFAHRVGFDGVGITDISPVPHADALMQWLQSGMAATMTYMHRQATRRLEPATIAPGAIRAVVVTRNYYTPDGPVNARGGRIAKYARGRDYHDALREPLEHLAAYIVSLGEEDTIARAYVDAGPVPERELAQRAGLGWIAKNTMLISPHRGSFFFLATVLTSLDLAVDTPFDVDRCGSCRRCLEACPTAALPQPRTLDSRRCISYLTIEHRGEIDEKLQLLLGQWLFGCDICQDVCPWNIKFSEIADDSALALDQSHEYVEPGELLELTDQEFTDRYGWTAMERPGVRGMQRNARIVSRNVGPLSAESQPPQTDVHQNQGNPTD